MKFAEIIKVIADILFEFDSEMPIHKDFKPGIGPFGEPQLVKAIACKLNQTGITARTKRSPDLDIDGKWAIEVKIVRPFGDNGNEAENWSVNMLHPYPGNVSLLSDAYKLLRQDGYLNKGLLVIGFEHQPAKIALDPLIYSFEAIAHNVMNFHISERIEEKRENLVHPVHRVLRCFGWEIRNLIDY